MTRNSAHGRLVRRMMQLPALASAFGVLLFAACTHPDAAVAPSGEASDFFDRFTMQETAVNLALVPSYDTVQLHPTAQFADGTAVPDSVSYAVSDSTITVSPTGLVTAHFVTTTSSSTPFATVTASVTHNGQTRSVVVRVQVRSTLPSERPSSVHIQTIGGAPARAPVIDTFANSPVVPLGLVVNDQHGTPLATPDIVFDVLSSDTSIAAIAPEGFVTVKKSGHVTFYMQTLAYGAHLIDSLPFTITVKQFGNVAIHAPNSPYSTRPIWTLLGDTVRIAAGGHVEWSNEGTPVVDILFANPTSIDSAAAFGGNVPPTGKGNISGMGATVDPSDFFGYYAATYRARRFPVAGTYPFTVKIHDPSVTTQLGGVVIVCAADAIVCNP